MADIHYANRSQQLCALCNASRKSSHPANRSQRRPCVEAQSGYALSALQPCVKHCRNGGRRVGLVVAGRTGYNLLEE